MRLRFLAALTAALLLALGGPSGGAKNAGAQAPARGGSAEGQLLIAAPHMPDPRFAQTVIYMVTHNAQGAFGLVINRPIGAGPMREFLLGLGLKGGRDSGEVLLHYGGPVEPGRLFVLHTSDWKTVEPMAVHGEIAVTSHPDILKAIAEGRGPRHSLVILGYTGWGAAATRSGIGPRGLDHRARRSRAGLRRGRRKQMGTGLQDRRACAVAVTTGEAA